MSSFTSRISSRGSRGSRFVRVHVARRTAHGAIRCIAAAVSLHAASAAKVAAQQVPAAAAPAVSLMPYRAPSIALVQPGPGATVPLDRPVIVLRFAQGEASDPLDLATMRVTVDGRDRTRLFQVTPAEAWGPLAAQGEFLAQGEHTVAARICSSRGACASLVTALAVVAPSHGLQMPAANAPAAMSSTGSVLRERVANAAGVAAAVAASAAASAAARAALP